MLEPIPTNIRRNAGIHYHCIVFVPLFIPVIIIIVKGPSSTILVVASKEVTKTYFLGVGVDKGQFMQTVISISTATDLSRRN